jgi:hypothetical protein
MENERTVIHIRLPLSDADALRDQALTESRSVSNLAGLLIREGLARRSPTPTA